MRSIIYPILFTTIFVELIAIFIRFGGSISSLWMWALLIILAGALLYGIYWAVWRLTAQHQAGTRLMGLSLVVCALAIIIVIWVVASKL